MAGSQSPDIGPVVIVGGGISGLAVACELARAGLKILVLDSAEIGDAASTRNQGWLHSGAWFAPRDSQLARSCHESLRQTLERYPECLEPDAEPMAFLITSPETDASAYTRAWEESGIPFEDWPLADLFKRLPGLKTSEVRRAFRLPDRAFRPEVLLTRLMETAEGLGVEIRLGTTVTALQVSEGRVFAVATNREEVRTGHVILAGNAGGAFLWPSAEEGVGFGTSGYRRILLRTHLAAARPPLGAVPFCVVDDEGLNYVPHGGTSILGTDRWLPAGGGPDEGPAADEVARLWQKVERLFPDCRREIHEAAAWAGTTVQAMHVGQSVPGRAPRPTVIDHTHETPRVENLLSVFPGRVSLWAVLAEQCRQVLLAKG